jgi:pyridoxine 5-phosphate synthase
MVTKMRTNLSINLNKVALLRNQRQMPYPSVLEAAHSVINAGAHGITAHPRPDERHITRRDVRELAAMLQRSGPAAVEYNIEGYPSPEWIALVKEARPDQATLVPDPPDAHTSDEGWDIRANRAFLEEVIGELKGAGIRVSLFVDCDPERLRPARDVGADRVELYTGPYGFAFGKAEEDEEFARCVAAAEAAHDAGLGLNAGHDLNLENLPRFRRAVPWLLEVSIGHAFTADALRLGYAGAIKAYLRALRTDEARPELAVASR